MGRKRRGDGGPSTAARAASQAVSLREESSGRTRVDEASLLRVKHLQRLAAWASAEAGVGPIGTLLGRRLAASAEDAGVPLSAATFLCQRCETVLKPGFNCTIRIKNNRKKTKRKKKSNCCQNSVAYACHFCRHQNLIWGGGKGAVKSLLSSRVQASMASTCRMSRGDNGNTGTQDMKEVLKHSQAAVLQANTTFRLGQSTSERDEHGERLTPKLPKDCQTEEDVILSAAECGHPAVNTNDEDMHETDPISSKKVKICGDSVTAETEYPVGSKFVTPQKNKLAGVTDPKHSAEPFKTRGTGNKKEEISGSVTGNALTSSSKSAPDSRKNIKSATSDSAKVSGSSRKLARKGWATLKQIAEKDELERKEKMGNFVIPLFMP